MGADGRPHYPGCVVRLVQSRWVRRFRLQLLVSAVLVAAVGLHRFTAGSSAHAQVACIPNMRDADLPGAPGKHTAWSQDTPRVRIEAPDATAAIRLKEQVGERLDTSECKRVISYSLYGDGAEYFLNMARNIALSLLWFPGWTIRIYARPGALWKSLQLELASFTHVELVIPRDGDLDMNPMFWRFTAAEDSGVCRAIFRDSDTLLDFRDAISVHEWEQDGTPFHIQRDHASHDFAVLGGMWGAVQGALDPLLQEIRAHHGARTHGWGLDQDILRDVVYPMARSSATQHDSSHFCRKYRADALGGTVRPFPLQRKYVVPEGIFFVGQKYDSHGSCAASLHEMRDSLHDDFQCFSSREILHRLTSALMELDRLGDGDCLLCPSQTRPELREAFDILQTPGCKRISQIERSLQRLPREDLLNIVQVAPSLGLDTSRKWPECRSMPGDQRSGLGWIGRWSTLATNAAMESICDFTFGGAELDHTFGWGPTDLTDGSVICLNQGVDSFVSEVLSRTEASQLVLVSVVWNDGHLAPFTAREALEAACERRNVKAWFMTFTGPGWPLAVDKCATKAKALPVGLPEHGFVPELEVFVEMCPQALAASRDMDIVVLHPGQQLDGELARAAEGLGSRAAVVDTRYLGFWPRWSILRRAKFVVVDDSFDGQEMMWQAVAAKAVPVLLETSAVWNHFPGLRAGAVMVKGGWAKAIDAIQTYAHESAAGLTVFEAWDQAVGNAAAA